MAVADDHHKGVAAANDDGPEPMSARLHRPEASRVAGIIFGTGVITPLAKAGGDHGD